MIFLSEGRKYQDVIVNTSNNIGPGGKHSSCMPDSGNLIDNYISFIQNVLF